MIRDAAPGDVAALAALYNHYVVHTAVSFEEVPVDEAELTARIGKAHHWLVATDGDAVVGYAYAGRWRERSAYRHSVETSVYVAAGRGGRGHGRALMEALLDRLGRADVHAVVAGVTLPNDASVALHERLGFRKVAHFSEVGFKLGRWHDVGYWQLLL